MRITTMTKTYINSEVGELAISGLLSQTVEKKTNKTDYFNNWLYDSSLNEEDLKRYKQTQEEVLNSVFE